MQEGHRLCIQKSIYVNHNSIGTYWKQIEFSKKSSKYVLNT